MYARWIVVLGITAALAGCGSSGGSKSDASTTAESTPAQSSAGGSLVGTVGENDAFTITLAQADGTKVDTLKAGTYKIVIHDDSTIHNYELDGPNGKSWTFTSVPFKGTKTQTLKLAAGAYKAYCAPHEASMFQSFTVS